MKLSRRLKANRANARRSTGPKSALGKTRSAANAFQHGLSVPISCDPELQPCFAELALAVAGKAADERRLIAARRIAEAQIDIVRIQRVRRRRGPRVNTSPEALAEALASDAALDRYERRARSRRTAAIRAFERLELGD